MAFLDRLEKGALFRLTRFVALAVVSFLTLALLVGVAIFFKDFVPGDSDHVAYRRISEELDPPKVTNDPGPSRDASLLTANPNDDLELPVVVQPYFSDPSNRKILKSHLQYLNSDEREDYLKNLGEIVQSAMAEKATNDRIIAVINRFFEDKEDQIRLARMDRESRRQRQLYLLGATVTILGTIAVASLVLVLLAVERNTRGLQRGAA